jgi:elongation factor 2
VNHARKLWTFGPGESGANLLVDRTQSVQLMNEVKESVVTAFKWATSEGVLVEEPMRGVRLNILDATVRKLNAHTGRTDWVYLQMT